MTVTEKPSVRVSFLRCGAARKQGEGPCGQKAGWGTDHPGAGRCKLHGGASPIVHGRYSKVSAARLKLHVADQASDPDPLSLFPELQLLRALTVDYINRYEEHTEALLAWHSSFGKPGAAPAKPRKVMDLIEAGKLLELTGRAVDRIQKQTTDVTKHPTFLHVVREMGKHVLANVDNETRLRILAGWRSIQRPGMKSRYAP